MPDFQFLLTGVSDNVGDVKCFLSVLIRALRRAPFRSRPHGPVGASPFMKNTNKCRSQPRLAFNQLQVFARYGIVDTADAVIAQQAQEKWEADQLKSQLSHNLPAEEAEPRNGQRQDISIQ